MKRHTAPPKTQDKDAEKAFFDELAETGDAFKPKPDREYDLVFSELGLDRDLSGLRVLEAGCATGEFGARMAKRNAEVVGVDISEGMIALNRRLNAGVPNYRAFAGDIEDPALFEPDSFDAAVSFNVLHHFPDCSRVIENLALWLRDGGVVYAEEPNGGNLTNRISKAGRAVVKTFLPRLLHERKLSSENEEHDYTMAEYLDIFGRHGFSCVRLNAISGRDAFPSWRGFSVETAISAVKWVLYVVTERLAKEPLNRGNYLVFAMRVEKGGRSDDDT